MFPSAAALVEKLPRTLRRHRLMQWWMALTGEDPVQLVRIRDEAFGYADMGDGFLRLIVIDQGFESDFFRIADSLLGNGGVFLDAGANYGLLSFGLAGKHGNSVDFHLFEPNPRLVAAIEKSALRYPAMRRTINQVAVADREGGVSFFFDNAQTGASHIAEHGPDQVKCMTLDGYIAQKALARVELLKLDVEGYELVALRGAQRALESKAVQAIYFEYFEKWLLRVQPPQELFQFLQSMGYEVCFCRTGDLESRGGPTSTIRQGLPGHGLPLLPVQGKALPSMTDLLAVPRENMA
jgi:FkbM family methyltransferase